MKEKPQIMKGYSQDPEERMRNDGEKGLENVHDTGVTGATLLVPQKL